jgi:hypothetical protein
MTIPEALRAHYTRQFVDLFALVQARHPERGVATLFQRVEAAKVACPDTPWETLLEDAYQAAHRRTMARLALLGGCSVKS